jgi:phage terminase large subunit-like protein
MVESIDHVKDALTYARNVVKGKVKACKWVRLACKRQLDDLKNKHCIYKFDADKANRVCNFIEKLPHIKGEWAKRGESIRLESWQKFILTTVFGWTRGGGRRRFRIAYIEVPRKNGKSSLSAAVGLYMLTEDGEIGGEVYSAAVNRDQAKIVFQDAQNMARKEHEFRDYYGIQVNARNINVLKTASKFEALSAEANSLDGLNVHCAIIDELHAHKTRQVFDVLETSMGARSQPLMWAITTAGSNRSGICYEQRSYLQKILEDTIEDDNYFGVIFSIDEKDNWKRENIWRKANPNLDVSIYSDEIKRLCTKAQELASAQNSFLTKHLNVWVNADVAWMEIAKWGNCGDTRLKLDEFAGEDCWIGVDLSSKVDITSIGLIFNQDSKYTAFCKHFLPGENVHSEAHAKSAHYEGWAIDGWLELTSGNMIDLDYIEEVIRELLNKFNIRSIAFDPWQAAQIMGRLLDDGAPVVEVRPTVQNFSDPMKMLEAFVGARRFLHQNDPVLSWMVSNVVGHRDAKDNIYPRKEQPQNKIDGVIALLMALNRALADSGEGNGSVYDDRGLLYVG